MLEHEAQRSKLATAKEALPIFVSEIFGRFDFHLRKAARCGNPFPDGQGAPQKRTRAGV
jgi:hypothetical protein